MNRPFTVYFDTNFYVWLGSASDLDAQRVIRVFNELEIRYVHSSYVVLELLSGKERSPQDRNLVERMQMWNIEAFPITLGYSNEGEVTPWSILLLTGNNRHEYSKEIKNIFDLEATARSYSHIADKPNLAGQQATLDRVIVPFNELIGLTEESTEAERSSAYLKFGAERLGELREFFSPETQKKFDNIDFAGPATAENLTDLAKKLKDILGDPVVAKLEQEVQLVNSVLALDDRPMNVATGQSSPIELKKLGNSMRDAIHMRSFVSNTDQIDLLQVDSKQLSLIKRNKPEHFIRKQGLSNRCFSTPDLESTVKYVLDRSMSS